MAIVFVTPRRRTAEAISMSTSHTDTTDQILKNLDGLLPDLEALYKNVHAHPELSMQESRTRSGHDRRWSV
jgi:hypothetical protein